MISTMYFDHQDSNAFKLKCVSSGKNLSPGVDRMFSDKPTHCICPSRFQSAEGGGSARAGEEGSLWKRRGRHPVPSYRRGMQRQRG